MTAQPFPLTAQPLTTSYDETTVFGKCRKVLLLLFCVCVSHCLKNWYFNYVCFNASNPNIVMKLHNLIWLDRSYEVCKPWEPVWVCLGRSIRATVRAPDDCLRAFYGPELVGSPCRKVVIATRNVVRVRVTCRAIRVSVLTGPVN